MTKVHTLAVPIQADIVDAFCVLQKGFTDQFVYYDKQRPCRYLGLGRCIALSTLEDVEYEVEQDSAANAVFGGASCERGAAASAAGDPAACGHAAGAGCGAPDDGALAGGCGEAAGRPFGQGAQAVSEPPVFFSFNRFDAENPAQVDELTEAFPRLRFMLPEIVLIENERGRFLQVNSLSPVYHGRVARFVKQAAAAPSRVRASVPIEVIPDSREQWQDNVSRALSAIRSGRVDKVVLSRRQKIVAAHPFSSKDLVVNLIDGDARGTVLLYRYADVFFCGCTPELLIRKSGTKVESMCLAGTCPAGSDETQRAAYAAELLDDAKNRNEHEYVVNFIREVFRRTCYDVKIPETPGILPLRHVQHLHTPAAAQVLEGVDLWSLMGDLHPTPATAGTPVGEAKMLIRRIEAFNRGFFAGACGFVNGDGDGEFSVALRTGVFDGETGWAYAGCGIVEGSVADDEYDEISLKLKTILSAFDGEGAA